MKQKQRMHWLGKMVKKIQISVTMTNSNGSSQLICRDQGCNTGGRLFLCPDSCRYRLLTDRVPDKAMQLLRDTK